MPTYNRLIATMAASPVALSGEASLASFSKMSAGERNALRTAADDMERLDAVGGIAARVQIARRINLDAAFLASLDIGLRDPKGGANAATPLGRLNAAHDVIRPLTGPTAKSIYQRDVQLAVNASSKEKVDLAKAKQGDVPARANSKEKDINVAAKADKATRDAARNQIGKNLADARAAANGDNQNKSVLHWTAIKAAIDDVAGLIRLGKEIANFNTKIGNFRRSLYLPLIEAQFDRFEDDAAKQANWRAVCDAANEVVTKAHREKGNASVDPTDLAAKIEAAVTNVIDGVLIGKEKEQKADDQKAREAKSTIYRAVKALGKIAVADGGFDEATCKNILRYLKPHGIVEPTKAEGNTKAQPTIDATPPRAPRRQRQRDVATSTTVEAGPVVADVDQLSTELAA